MPTTAPPAPAAAQLTLGGRIWHCWPEPREGFDTAGEAAAGHISDGLEGGRGWPSKS